MEIKHRNKRKYTWPSWDRGTGNSPLDKTCFPLREQEVCMSFLVAGRVHVISKMPFENTGLG